MVLEVLSGEERLEQAEELLTVQEVAERLRVNEATVRRWVKSGAIKAVSLPHKGKREIFRIRKSTLEAILKDQGWWT